MTETLGRVSYEATVRRSGKLSAWVRIGFAGPGAVIIAIVVMGGMTQWLPAGAAGIDNLVLPLVLLPLIWAGLFFHACLDRNLGRVAVVALGLFMVHGGLIAREFVAPHASIRQAE